MQPVKITIQGDYLDCQIYRGRLYLWSFDGLLKTYKWDEIVYSLIKKDYDRLAFKFCFIDGNYLYKNDLVELFDDKEFKEVVLKKFQSVAEGSYSISENESLEHLFGVQDNLGNSLPTDTEIFGNSLYYINEKGLFCSTTHRASTKYPVSSKPQKLWDCNLLSIKANKYPQLALSGGSEGLFEISLYKEYGGGKEPKQISKKHSSFSNYTFWSIYNSSLVDNSYLALFNLNEVENDNTDLPPSRRSSEPKKFQREYVEQIDELRIFQGKTGNNNLSWGVEDKIYRTTINGFEVVKFNNKPKEGEELFTPIQSLNLQPWKGKVISGGSSYFGTIIECENALVVMLSDGSNYTIEGPITRWRIYPRSLNYQNHLHVIKDDCIEIYSFNQDYFLNQEDKVLGTQYRRTNWRSW